MAVSFQPADFLPNQALEEDFIIIEASTLSPTLNYLLMADELNAGFLRYDWFMLSCFFIIANSIVYVTLKLCTKGKTCSFNNGVIYNTKAMTYTMMAYILNSGIKNSKT